MQEKHSPALSLFHMALTENTVYTTGQMVTDSKCLLQMVTAFYTDLYQEERTSPETMKCVVDSISTTISEEERFL